MKPKSPAFPAWLDVASQWQFCHDTRVWTQASGRSTQSLSNTEAAQDALVRRQLAEANDLSLHSDFLAALPMLPAVQAALRPSRADILRPVEAHLKGRTLEVEGDWGTVTRFLAEKGCEVVSVTPQKSRAAVVAQRCRDRGRVTVLSGEVTELRGNGTFRTIVALGATSQMLPRRAPLSMAQWQVRLATYARLLADDGTLLLSVDNTGGLEPFAVPPGTVGHDGPRAASYVALMRHLGHAGFTQTVCFLPFHRAGQMVVIVPETAPVVPTEQAQCLAYAFSLRDWLTDSQRAQVMQPWPFKVDPAVRRAMAPAFFIAARKQVAISVEPDVVAYCYSSNRRKSFARCLKAVATGTAVQLESAPLEAQPAISENDLALKTVTSAVQGGHSLAALQEVLNAPGWSVASVVAWASEWHAALLEHVQPDGQGTLSGKYLDWMPSKLQRSSEALLPLDPELDTARCVPLRHLVLRGIFYALRLCPSAAPAPDVPATLGALALAVAQRLGHGIGWPDLLDFVSIEAQRQATVYGFCPNLLAMRTTPGAGPVLSSRRNNAAHKSFSAARDGSSLVDKVHALETRLAQTYSIAEATRRRVVPERLAASRLPIYRRMRAAAGHLRRYLVNTPQSLECLRDRELREDLLALFDSGYYVARYGASIPQGVDPLTHYLTAGADAGNDPNAWFCTDFYKRTYPDVANTESNPFVHYVTFGWREGRQATKTAVGLTPGTAR